MATVSHCVVGLALVLASGPFARAAWLTISNPTDKVVVIQETQTLNGRVVKGKEHRLAPGEVLKEFQTGVGDKTVLVSEKDGTRPPARVKLSWGKEDTAYMVSMDGPDVKLAAKTK